MDTGPERAETVGRRRTCTRPRSPFTLLLTATNKRALQAAVGHAQIVEIVLGKAYSFDDVAAAVRQALPRDGEQSGSKVSRCHSMPISGSMEFASSWLTTTQP